MNFLFFFPRQPSRARPCYTSSMIQIRTGFPEWDEFWPKVKGFMEANWTRIEKPWTGGDSVAGYHTPDCPWLWLRDNVHMMLASVWLLDDDKCLLDLFIEHQNEDGSFHDFIDLEGNMLRVPTEADLEYLAVVGVYRAWLACGDDEWMISKLPSLERGLEYMTSHPWRWDPVHKMPKRAYTIDTWDFDIREDLEELHWPGKIDEKTHFGIMHGDVSGVYYAWKLMSEMLQHLGRDEEAKKHDEQAKDLRERANELLWNGRFYRHRHPLDDFRVEGVDEEQQLSLSNPYDINRGLPTPSMARSIIREYFERRGLSKAFAEWFSIDPPFPTGVFGDEKLKPGVYVNGGIMPIVGGELARAAFRYGYPEYGVDILQRYFRMIDSTGEAYLWYFPDGRPATKEASTSPEAYPTDAWGSSAMAGALIQGLVGVRSGRPGFEALWLEPHWDAAGVNAADVTCEYPASGKTLHYTYTRDPEARVTEMVVEGSPLKALHLGLPDSVDSVEAEADGKRPDVEIESWELGKGCVFREEMAGKLRLRITER